MAIDYKKLGVWKEAHEFTLEVLKFLDNNDLNKNFRLRDQLQGSVISIGSNICEGSLGSKAELKRYLGIAIKSAVEAEYQVLILHDMGHISIDTYTHFKARLSKIIGGLINYSKKL